MLTDLEKNKILLEETYRQEVQKSLSEKSKNKYLLFFNSNLGIFILSSCVLSVITFAFTTYSTYRSNRIDRENQSNKIKIEVDYRIEIIKSMGDTLTYEDFNDARNAIIGRGETSHNGKTESFETFYSRNLFSLIYEYKQIHNEVVSENIKTAIKNLRHYIDGSIYTQVPHSREVLPDNEKINFQLTIHQLKEWNKN